MIWIGADFSSQGACSALLAEKPALAARTVSHAFPVNWKIYADGRCAFDVTGYTRLKTIIAHCFLPDNLLTLPLDFWDVAHTFDEILRGNFCINKRILKPLL